MASEEKEPEIEIRFRRYANWSAVVGTALGAGYFSGFLIYHSLVPGLSEGSWFLQVLEKNYAACIGVPLSALTAFCVVLLLKIISTGAIEFEALGFKFRGASGPVVLWIFCFLAVIFGVYLLWGK